MRLLHRVAIGLSVLIIHVQVMAQAVTHPQLAELAAEYTSWSAENQPSGPFAAVRPDRPAGWQPDWSRTALQARKSEYLQFQARLKALNAQLSSTADRIDAALLGASMARIFWELEVLASPRRDPGFALDQSLGSIFELLIENPVPNEAQISELIVRMKRFPAIINAAKLGLDETVGVLAERAQAQMEDLDSRIDALETALAEFVPDQLKDEFEVGIRAARQALASYKDWLALSRVRFDTPIPIGQHKLRWYLGHVALVPRSVDSILVETELALAQMGAQEALDKQRFANLPESSGLQSIERLILMLGISRSEIGNYLSNASLVSVSDENSAVEYSALPATLAPLVQMGELMAYSPDGGPIKRYLQEADQAPTFLENAAWTEPRLLLSFEDLPGLAMQIQQAATNTKGLRQRASDCALGKGIALYFHEQLFKAGLYAFKPDGHQLAVKLLSYYAAMAQADIRLAIGTWSFDEARRFLRETAGRGAESAVKDVRNLIANPGVAAASFAVYGQVVRFLADSSRLGGETFSLQEFNDRLLRNAHVPIALQRWESLGLEDELQELIEQRGRPATVPE